jgi:hypothetical protein
VDTRVKYPVIIREAIIKLSALIRLKSALIREPLMNADTTRMNANIYYPDDYRIYCPDDSRIYYPVYIWVFYPILIRVVYYPR